MKRWFVSRQGKLTGPFELLQLQALVEAKNLGPGDLVCQEGGQWTSAGAVPGLFDRPVPDTKSAPGPAVTESVGVAPVAPVAAFPTNPASPAATLVAAQSPTTRGAGIEGSPKPLEESPDTSDAVFGMSRLVYRGVMLGGWSALVGWGVAELLIGRWVNDNVVFAVLMVIIVGITLGGGLSQIGGLSAFQGRRQLIHLGPGVLGGLCGGIVGGLLGNLFFFLMGDRHAALTLIGRVVGWTLLGIAVGICEGLLQRHWRKIRNGLIGGTLGGFIGGLIFNPVSSLIGSPISSRAFAFVAVGLCLGLFISLIEVLMKEAWLTVEAGFRPGRQLILKQEATTMGTSEKAGLIFIAFGAKGVEPMHLRVCRHDDGTFYVEDLNSRTGTLLNGSPVLKTAPLTDSDLIEFGVNKVRFNSRAVASHASQRIGASAKPA